MCYDYTIKVASKLIQKANLMNWMNRGFGEACKYKVFG